MRLFTVLAVCATFLSVPSAATAASCFDRAAAVTYEESRIETPALPGGTRVPYELVRVGGFDPYVAALKQELCRATSVETARRMLEQQGTRLWQTAVARAQGRIQLGTIDRYDDRPLYWSRLIGTRDLRQWRPAFPLSAADRAALLKTYEYASRGVAHSSYGTGVKRVLVSGFDPYQLNGEIRRSNPSGGSALQLDGLTYRVGTETVRVRAVVLPVTWSGFDAGIVEDAFGPHLTGTAPERADLIMTISQGNRGAMVVERWAGAWRGGFADNNNVGEAELIPAAPRWPQPAPTPEFIETTLPHQAMIGAGTGPWPTSLNQNICEWAAGTRPTGPVRCHPNGPSAGSQAQAGGGGNYLSNESMYRSNRLRRELGASDVPGGHLHISALVYPTNPLVIIDAAFTADRAATINQTVALVRAAGAAA
ncbi:hypothetical protein [Actinoplanes sp. NPDC051859]|uniref:hypothetical protein n=1 Tax=Actinoplanes sp. NPDC051859 TaxID=3363909 RepID=UPI00378963C9